MIRKALALGVAFFIVGVALAAWGQGKSPNRIVSEKLIGKIHPSFIAKSLNVSPDSKRVAYVVINRGFFTGDKFFVVVDGKEEKQYDNILATPPPIFSPDSKRVAYGARTGDKWLVFVDGKEDKPYDDILKGTPIFSPDSKHVAYGAKVGNKWLVVVDGKEGKPYDGFPRGTRIVFDSPDAFHYLARAGEQIYLVEER